MSKSQIPVAIWRKSSSKSLEPQSSLSLESPSNDAEHFNTEHSLENIMNQISNYFGLKSLPSSSQSSLNAPQQKNLKNAEAQYYSDIFRNELDKEKRYNALFTKGPNRANKRIHNLLRGRTVHCIMTAAARFKYSPETVYIAVFLMDAFLQHKAIKTLGWSLLGLTVLHLAGKVEEKSRASLKKLKGVYYHFAKFSLIEVAWMEQEILKAVRYMVHPPTPKIFIDLAFNSGQVTFPSKFIKSIIGKLTHEILFRSLKEYEMRQYISSFKAALALQIATRFVMSHLDFDLKTTKKSPQSVEDAVSMCYHTFLRTLRTITLENLKLECPPRTGNESLSSEEDNSPKQNGNQFHAEMRGV